MGTSSGALAGSLYCAGMSPAEVTAKRVKLLYLLLACRSWPPQPSGEQVAAELNRVRPIEIVRPCFRPWRGGILSLHKVVERLQQLLPATFEELNMVSYDRLCLSFKIM